MRFIAIALLAGLSVACATAAQGPASAGYPAQKFDLHKSGHIVVPAEINGRTAYLVVDTGAGATVLDRSSIALLHLAMDEKGSEQAIGAGGAGLDIQSSTGNRFEFAGTHADDFTFRVMNLNHVVDALSSPERPIVGVIGADWLDKHGAVINYAERTIAATK